MILFCRFFAPARLSGLIFSKPMKTRRTPARFAFLDEVRNLVAERIDLNEQRKVDVLAQAQIDQPIKDRFPIFVAREIVIGDEKIVETLGEVFADDLLDVVRRTAARFVSLHIDDGAEGTLEWATATGVEAGHGAVGARGANARDERDGFALDSRQVRHVIVERLELAGESIPQNHFQTAFLGFAGKKRNAHRFGAMKIGIVAAEHAHRARNMETADGDLNAVNRETDLARSSARGN